MQKEKRGAPQLRNEVGIGLIHLSPLALFWIGAPTAFDWFVCAFLYFMRMFFVTGAYHRYFSHRTYKTSRWFQFYLAFMAQTSVQKGVLWWAAHHRDHHRHSDTPQDPHSMKIYGFLYSHIGWIVGPDYKETNYNRIKDFAKFPELRFISKYHLIPVVTLAILVTFLGGYINSGYSTDFMTVLNAGWTTLFCGFLLSTVFLYHGTFSINSIMHYFGRPRYQTGDESRNNLILALITLGEGWHNNHHYYPSTVRQGFFWWEIDITYYILKVFSWLGLVWDLQEVPHYIKHSKNMDEAMQKKKEFAAQKETYA